jgi:putative ABC transport system ATP-binding protein
MLEAINLSKTYTGEGVDYHVLKNINLKIDEGECAAIIGKSGSGKSTLMHLLACLDTPSAGSIMFDGEDLSALTEHQRDLLRNSFDLLLKIMCVSKCGKKKSSIQVFFTSDFSAK